MDKRLVSRAWFGPAVAISVLAVLIIGVVVAQRDSSDDSADPATTTSVTSEETSTENTGTSTSTSTSTSTTGSTTTTAPDPWEEIPILLNAGPAGQYRTGVRFFEPFSITLPEGWQRAFPELSDIVEMSPTAAACESDQKADDCLGLVTVYEALVPTVDEAVAELQALPGVAATAPEPIELAGASGFRFTLTTDQPFATVHIIRDGGNITISSSRTFVTHVLDIAGQPAVLILDAPNDSSFPLDALPVVESIVWRSLDEGS